MTLISKQLRKDVSFNRCDLIMKEILEEFCQCFQTTLSLMDCTSPIRVKKNILRNRLNHVLFVIIFSLHQLVVH